MLCVPITSDDGDPIGAIQVVNSHDGKTFTEKEVLLLSAFRGYIQVTTMNRQQQLNRVGDIMNVDASRIDLAFLSDKLVDLSQAERGTIFVLEENDVGEPELYMIADTEYGKQEARIPYTSTSIAGAAMQNNEIINIPGECHIVAPSTMLTHLAVQTATRMSGLIAAWT